jgi:hypothetical protein
VFSRWEEGGAMAAQHGSAVVHNVSVVAPCFGQRLGMEEVGLRRGWAEQEQSGRMARWVGVAVASSNRFALANKKCKN